MVENENGKIKRRITTIALAAVAAVLAALSVKAIIAENIYYENPVDAYLANPDNGAPNPVVYDTVKDAGGVFRVTDEEAVWIGVVKPSYAASAALEKEYVILTFLSVKDGKYKHKNAQVSMFDPTALELVDDPQLTWTCDGLSDGKTLYCGFFRSDQPLDSLPDDVQKHLLTLRYETRSCKIYFCYRVE